MDPVVEALLIAFFVALIIAFIATSSLRAELKSVRQATEANIYIKDGSFNLTNEQDIYLCRKVEKTARPKQQS
ncbi:MAG: hypothetical protein IKP88_03265 [Lachnospiraceae bacterium]|nr:hypothetical protein [Lachnospiraceae bacterium]